MNDRDHSDSQKLLASDKLSVEDPDEVEHKVYARRWYILVVFALLNLLQSVAWNTWGPIADTSKAVLDWNGGDIALLTNWGPITYILFGFLFSWILDTRGLRLTVVVSAVFLLLGVGVRCLPVGIYNTKWTMNVGQILIGIAGPGLIGGPTMLSALWFPPHQRTTATAISTTAASLGFAVSFLIGPQIVTDVETTNGTSIDPVNGSSIWFDDGTAIDPTVRTYHFKQIMLLMYIEAAVCAVLIVFTLIYFPAKPPTPPSVSAATTRESFKTGAFHLAKNWQFWFIALAGSISIGVFTSWNTQLDAIFQHVDGVGQSTLGWIGFYTSVAGVIGGLIFARFVDRFGGSMKRVILVLAIIAFGFCLWCFLLALRYIPFNIAHLYIACISQGFFAMSRIPIFYEITVEGVYPVSEGITTMVLTLMNNIVALLFLLPPLIQGIGNDWMSWVELSATGIAIPLVLLYRESYNRMKKDEEDKSIVGSNIQGDEPTPVA